MHAFLLKARLEPVGKIVPAGTDCYLGHIYILQPGKCRTLCMISLLSFIFYVEFNHKAMQCVSSGLLWIAAFNGPRLIASLSKGMSATVASPEAHALVCPSFLSPSLCFFWCCAKRKGQNRRRRPKGHACSWVNSFESRSCNTQGSVPEICLFTKKYGVGGMLNESGYLFSGCLFNLLVQIIL